MTTKSRAAFDYSSAQWKEIQKPVEKVRGTELSQRDRGKIRAVAIRYLEDVALHQSGFRAPGTEGPRRFAKVARLCGELRTALAEAREFQGRGLCFFVAGEAIAGFLIPVLTDHRFAFHDEEQLDTLKEALLRLRTPQELAQEKLNPQAGILGPVIESVVVEKLLGNVEFAATDMTDPWYWKPSLRHSWTGRLDPPVVFAQKILTLWNEHFGGSLTLQGCKGSNEYRGSLVDFFFAIARPVMKASTPSNQSIRDAVRRQKEMRGYFDLLNKLETNRVTPEELRSSAIDYLRAKKGTSQSATKRTSPLPKAKRRA